MKLKTINFVTFIVFLTTLVSCAGSEPITLDLIPVPSGAIFLEVGENDFVDSLYQNLEQDSQLHDQFGLAGGIVEQRVFRLSSNTSWREIDAFYERELEGWERGIDISSNVLINRITARVNKNNDLFQSTIWNKNGSILTIVRIVDPLNKSAVYLIQSLSDGQSF